MTEQKKTLREIDTPFYNYWQALYLSFFSSRLYVDVGKRWKGFGLLYLLLLMFIVSIPFAMRVTSDFNRFINEEMIQPLEQLPSIYIQNGKVSFDKPMPYMVKNKSGQVVLIVDTTGKVQTIDKTYPHLTTLITKNKFMYRFPSPQFFFSKEPVDSESSLFVQTISEQVNEVFDGKRWVKSSGIERVKYLSAAIIYPMVALIFFAMYLVFFLAFALMGQFVAKLFLKLSLGYKQASRLLIVSSTPQIVLLLFMLTMGWLFNWFGIVLLIVLSIYFTYAIISLKRESHKLVVS
ncbi:TPA: DUF1189 family protein [Legionella feeleii]|uniref:Protein of uncharacterized function (DUF1189) n=1 Tax=Legionella feeleii TaxID=453 RepID=A0A0W0U2N8_9GAMM|nr:DUF1189 family protein [Legionella feeleii]KTD01901.1 hypothetical protein Lfee_0948 [Legionella feeleii]SPX59422.1 Protein of uncharacterised function (DUF1189) [Legionella feeleii]